MRSTFAVIASFLLFALFATNGGADASTSFFVVAKIPEKMLSRERNEKYADPLDVALREAGYGSVTGGFTHRGDGKSSSWSGIDIELKDLSDALEFTRAKLRSLGVPLGSVLEFDRDGKRDRILVHEETKAAEPGATDNPGYAQRVREDHRIRTVQAGCLSFIVGQNHEPK